jgi:Interferon-induced transmembrane protein
MSDYGSTPPPPPPPPPPPQPAYGGGSAQGAPPPNYLVWAILSTILCGCTSGLGLPVGIASIVFSTQVNSKWAVGDVAGAQAASEKAKKFAIATAIVGVVANVVVFLAFPGLRAGS